MNTLFIDTHDKNITLCLYKDGKVIDIIDEVSERNHSDLTMPLIKKLLENNNLTPNNLNEILVVNGPGSFTGVRIGVTIAKTFAYTLNIPIKTITSLQVQALGSNMNSEKLATIQDIKGVFGGLYSNNNELIGDLFYKSNEEFDKYIKENNLQDKIIVEKNFDFNKIYEYLKNIKDIPAHSVNPIYIKVIEVLKHD